ncbi:bifunctional hydroxymethylpyrimidine kinase/phosphomethylpyrimidine kinase [Corynebacterium sphenisci]|uniref:bifunctional hydroxymethylpyrimidine kinase/phosphomethylpyrimidine kinase n=1 Tax=Corynebacterium sphenisci TaxID=191493 RepID=UPI0026DEBD3B|nr:bifunctional hydroxymethylpyrimidine kinase/phosphomethylpyrimidine kinase [Corynebacterium sphenisci]MDO5732069.1 bifunctional hydroxymethylpyrimidine kinase/phosphomethylpyrimidine kinase [Corynebacterium sphenisci]
MTAPMSDDARDATPASPTADISAPAPGRVSGRPPRVLSIAGTDPTGGAGVHADLKAFAACGAYGMAAVTVLVAQNTVGVRELHAPPAEFLRAQLDAVSDDVAVDAVKLGMLYSAELIEVVADWLGRVAPPIVVLDPVMVATSGDRLLDATAERALAGLLDRVHLVTPNVPELAVLAGAEPAGDLAGLLGQARAVAARHGVAVLAKGGHLPGAEVPDALVAPDGTVTEFTAARVDTTCTHGTGCSLSAAVAALWPRTGDPAAAVARAKRWLTESLAHADELAVGRGHGPVHHFAGMWERGLEPARPLDLMDSWWAGIAGIRRGIAELPFIRGLAAGDLAEEDFAWYLAQDALYLNGYARALAAAAAKAPTQAEQMFWARSAHDSIAEEMELHRSFIGARAGAAAPEPSAVTRAYVDHLVATAVNGSYGEAVAAVLPCFWLYQDTGTRLVGNAREGHPYREWLETYADEGFADATREAIRICAGAAAAAAPAERAAMETAFRRSSWHELEFFAEPVRRHGRG